MTKLNVYAKSFVGFLVFLVIYGVLIRSFLLEFLYDHNMLSWYSGYIRHLNTIGRIRFTYGAFPLEEFQQRLDITLFQVFFAVLLVHLSLTIFRNKSRTILFTINVMFQIVAFMLIEIVLSGQSQQKKFGSVEYENLNSFINKKNMSAVNSHGFTDRERTQKKADGIFRIVVLGDSFVWGDGVKNRRDIWSHILEKKIHDKYRESIEVISWGRNGWSTHDELDFLKGPGSEIEFDFLIIGFVTNDPHIPEVSMPRRMFIWDKFARKRIPFFENSTRFICSQLNNFLYALPYFENWGYLGWRNALYSPENLQVYTNVVGQLKHHLDESGTRCVVVTLPIVDDFPYEEKYPKVLEIFARHDIPYLDLYPELKNRFGHYNNQQIRDQLWANPVNAHPGRVLSEFYADSVLSYLETNRIMEEYKFRPKMISDQPESVLY